jgi:hypothetical protein
MSKQTQIEFPVHRNSIEVYFDKVKPELKGRKLAVINALIELGGSGTMYEVGKLLNMPLNNISGRFSELVKSGKIDGIGIKVHNGNKFTEWKVL